MNNVPRSVKKITKALKKAGIQVVMLAIGKNQASQDKPCATESDMRKAIRSSRALRNGEFGSPLKNAMTRPTARAKYAIK